MENMIKMNNGIEIPCVGFGVYMMSPEECEISVMHALKNGYRLIDTANIYMNERAVGRAVKKSEIAREEIFLTTKLWPSDYGYEKTKKAIKATLKRLDTNYIDLLLLHQQYGDFIGAWNAMEEAVNAGTINTIGLSNFNFKNLKKLIDKTNVKPAIVQVECHPYFQEKELKDFLKPYGTIVESWYPLGHGSRELLEEPVFAELGKKYNKSNAQIILKWHIQDGNVVIPKSINPDHIHSNINLFDFELTDKEMSSIYKLDKKRRYFNMPELLQRIMFATYKPNFDKQK